MTTYLELSKIFENIGNRVNNYWQSNGLLDSLLEFEGLEGWLFTGDGLSDRLVVSDKILAVRFESSSNPKVLKLENQMYTGWWCENLKMVFVDTENALVSWNSLSSKI